jgi:PAS domain S-box-containing protein
MRIIIIDDENEPREILARLVCELGHDCRSATSALEGIRLLKEYKADAILTDLVMPEIRGDALLAKLADFPSPPSVIIVTGHADMESAINAVRFGAFDYLCKPVKLAVLSACLLRLARQQALQKRLEAEIADRAKADSLSMAAMQAEKIWCATFDAIEDRILILDAELRIQNANAAARKAYGETIQGRLCCEVVRHLVVPPDTCPAKKTLATGKSVIMEIPAELVSDSWLSVQTYPVTNEIGGVDGVVYVCTDITERKRLQDQLRQSEKMAALGQLAAGVAHEINNPVGFVTSNLGTLSEYCQTCSTLVSLYGEYADAIVKNDFESSRLILQEIDQLRRQEDLSFIIEDRANLIDECLDGMKRIREIVQGLKSFARADDNNPVEVDLNAAIESTLKVVWNELKYKCEIRKQLGVLPLVRCNAGQINQVVANLLVNAAHAIPEHGIIIIATEALDNDVIVRITDTGTGIPPEVLPCIFDPFFTTKPVGKGTGLGLSISHGIITEHGGAIEVQSEIGKGTTFTVRLPRTDCQ